MKIKSLVNAKRVEETAQFVTKTLTPWFDWSDRNGPVTKVLKECHTYSQGLTNLETKLVLLRALAALQQEIIRDITTLERHIWHDDEEAA
jgi:hypothetical protein